MAWYDAIMARLGRKPHQPQRDTLIYPNLVQVGRVNNISGLVYKATPRNLRYFSRTPYPRRAINAIKNPIKMLEWEIAPLAGVEWNSELKRQAEIVKTCFSEPNATDDFQSLLEQLLEDYLIGAGAVETRLGGSASHPLYMFPCDGLSIQIYPNWDPTKNKPRYAQTIGYGSQFGGGTILHLNDEELMYVRPNPNTATPFGFGPLEIAFNAIARLLAVEEFAGNVAGNARPSIGLDFPGLSPEQLQTIRSFWRNDVEGQGLVPMFSSHMTADGKTSGVEVLRFYPEGDAGLYLQYQEMLQRELAAAFDLSPQNLNLEGGSNRSTAEVSEDRDWAQAIRPIAHDISKALTRHCIKGLLGFSQLRFRFVGLDREDELNTSRILQTRYQTNSITANEIRDRFGEPKMKGQWGDMTWADVQIAMMAAKSAGEVLDADLPAAPPTTLGKANNQRTGN